MFTITSPYGTFEANGISQVPLRIKEIEAIVALKDVNEGAVVAKAAGESVVKTGENVAQRGDRAGGRPPRGLAAA